MDVLLFNVTTAALMVVMFKGGLALIGEGTVRRRGLPWAAVALTGLGVGGVVLQLCWSGAMGALDSDPAKHGWWRVLTSVFMQNGGIGGTVWNLATLAVMAAFAQWFWGGPLMLGLFLTGILLPERIDALFGQTSHSTDPRNFAGSSGATYFLGATLAAALLLHGDQAGKGGPQPKLLALGVPVLGLALWFAQSNGHGLVSAYGFAVGALAWLLFRRHLRPAPATDRTTTGAAEAATAESA
ncbi:hypothetical protein CFP65_1600 [Kitasatospora sp. MMS16-BH015]|uniref:hypothetical protein n=1 Tax=Kitasatospora sp. MMS16-BH015 TaxID=2018025 RepID=UPI000CA16455|nr:hypothetical protein [Kitasatospora sp. MMS16-BH015]AUG76487.1 hypothetical protein CFP65_1600 [Kitasatospora sp. MMS16-BH015]